MPIDFPSSANTGDIYTEGVYSYEYTGVKWKPVNRTDYTIEVSEIAPVDATPFDELLLDFNTDGVQYFPINSTINNVSFTNNPSINEYKKILLDVDVGASFTQYTPYATASDISYENVSFNTGLMNITGLQFSNDGYSMFVGSGNSIFAYELNDKWDISTASNQTEFPLTPSEKSIQPTLIGAVSAITRGSSTSYGLGISSLSPQAGDLILAVQSYSANLSNFFLLDPDNFTVTRAANANGAYDSVMRASMKISDGTETLVRFNFSGGQSDDSRAMVVLVYRNVDTSNPILDSAEASKTNGFNPIPIGNVTTNSSSVTMAFGASGGAIAPVYTGATNVQSDFGGNATTLAYRPTSTADMTTGSTDNSLYTACSITLSINGISSETNMKSFKFFQDGNQLIVNNGGTLDSYNLTSWNLNTVSKTETKILMDDIDDFDMQDYQGSGSKIFTIASNILYEYSLGTDYSISSTWSSVSNVNVPIGISNIEFSNSGDKVFLTSSNTTYSYTTNSWSLTNFSSESDTTYTETPTVVNFDITNSGYNSYTVDEFGIIRKYASYSNASASPALSWPSNLEWENGETPALPDLSENMQIEIEARTDYRGTNYVARLVGRNF